MGREEKFNIVAFDSTHMAMKAESILEGKEIMVRIIPVPKEVTASCGLSLKVKEENFEKVKTTLEKENVEVSGYYLVKKQGLRKEIVDITEKKS